MVWPKLIRHAFPLTAIGEALIRVVFDLGTTVWKYEIIAAAQVLIKVIRNRERGRA